MPNSKNISAVEKLSSKFEKAKAVYFTDYLGLDVASITDLRRKFYEADVEYTVAKNTLIKIAAGEHEITGLDEVLQGPTAIAISYGEPTAPARVLKNFTKTNDMPSVKGILFEGELLGGEEFKRLADLPSREELLSTLVATLQSPMTKLVRTFSASLTEFVGVLTSLKDKKS
ncbi:MAG: 50S ribosomal protein L10 [Fidelibacterota bacterium]